VVFTIDSGYTRKCKDSRGGVSEVYLFPFVEYANSQIITNGNILTTFPNTTIYKFYSNTIPNATENQEQDAGGKFYNQSIPLDLQYFSDYENISKLIKKDYRLIFKDNNGLYRIFGLYNGISSDSINYTTGTNKSEFNGFKMTFSTKEEKQSFFIENLSDAGFVEESFFRITELGEFRITQSGEFRITQ
jgi:hypothetical protein